MSFLEIMDRYMETCLEQVETIEKCLPIRVVMLRPPQAL